jgi:hypothetical protein
MRKDARLSIESHTWPLNGSVASEVDNRVYGVPVGGLDGGRFDALRVVAYLHSNEIQLVKSIQGRTCQYCQ